MKKFLFAVLISIVAITAPTVMVHAQFTQTFSKTITAADTTIFSAVPSKIKSFTYTLTKTSGTIAGKVYLEGGVIAGQWIIIDSLVLANVNTMQQKTSVLTATSFLNYRYRCTNDSAGVAAVKAAYLRRTDE